MLTFIIALASFTLIINILLFALSKANTKKSINFFNLLNALVMLALSSWILFQNYNYAYELITPLKSFMLFIWSLYYATLISKNSNNFKISNILYLNLGSFIIVFYCILGPNITFSLNQNILLFYFSLALYIFTLILKKYKANIYNIYPFLIVTMTYALKFNNLLILALTILPFARQYDLQINRKWISLFIIFITCNILLINLFTFEYYFAYFTLLGALLYQLYKQIKSEDISIHINVILNKNTIALIVIISTMLYFTMPYNLRYDTCLNDWLNVPNKITYINFITCLSLTTLQSVLFLFIGIKSYREKYYF